MNSIRSCRTFLVLGLLVVSPFAAACSSGATSDAGPIDPEFPWFTADSENVFVEGLSSEEIETSTGLIVGDVVFEAGENLVGPTISFSDGEVLVQLDASVGTFDDVVTNNPEASVEMMGSYQVAVLGGSGAVIDR